MHGCVFKIIIGTFLDNVIENVQFTVEFNIL